LVAVIAAADVVLQRRRLPRPLIALLDEPAHAATTALLLDASPVRPSPKTYREALIASVLLDADHVPSELGWDVLRRGAARPYAHTAVGIAAAAAPAGRGAAIGIATHLVRDAASGPGVTLGWPVFKRSQRVPAPLYHALIATAAARAAWRRGAPGPRRRDP
jgi:inner membrane protein